MEMVSDKKTERTDSSPKRGRPKKVSKKALMAAIKGSGGMEATVTDRLGGIPIRVLRGLLALYPDAERALRDERDAWEEELTQKAWEALIDAITRKEPWAIQFASEKWGDQFVQGVGALAKKPLSRGMKKRGYVKSGERPYGYEEIQEEIEDMKRYYKPEEFQYEPEPPLDYEPCPPIDRKLNDD